MRGTSFSMKYCITLFRVRNVPLIPCHKRPRRHDLNPDLVHRQNLDSMGGVSVFGSESFEPRNKIEKLVRLSGLRGMFRFRLPARTPIVQLERVFEEKIGKHVQVFEAKVGGWRLGQEGDSVVIVVTCNRHVRNTTTPRGYHTKPIQTPLVRSREL